MSQSLHSGPQSPVPDPQSPIAAFLRLSLPKTEDAGSRAFGVKFGAMP